jgi:hypothetical protein
MPSVDVGARQQDEAGTTSAEEGGETKANGSEQEELCAMVDYVVKDLAAELYTELLQGLHK